MPEINVDRRSLLASTGLLGIGAAVYGAFGTLAEVSAAVVAENAEAFQGLSEFLTGTQELDPALAERAYAQLSQLDAEFPRKMAALAETLRASGTKTFDAWLSSQKAEDASLATATTIVSAWYLGFTGTPIPLRADDDTGFVTFTEALMYEPTIDATVRPSYARAGTDYWIDPPPFVKPPPAPPRIRSWGRESPQGTGTIPGLDSVEAGTEPSAPAPVKSDP